MPTRRARTRATVGEAAVTALLLAIAAAGCAGGGPPREHGGRVPTDHPRIALLPFENLSGREEQGRLFHEAFLTALVRSGGCDVVEPGQVDVLLEALRIRSSGVLTQDQLASVGDSLNARYVLLGSILEAGTVRTHDGETPSAGASIRLVEVATGRIVWANLHVVTGDDRETVFGWGRERSAERLVARLADEMIRPFRDAGTAWRERTTKGDVAR